MLPRQASLPTHVVDHEREPFVACSPPHERIISAFVRRAPSRSAIFAAARGRLKRPRADFPPLLDVNLKRQPVGYRRVTLPAATATTTPGLCFHAAARPAGH
jgi:hypothetical protein